MITCVGVEQVKFTTPLKLMGKVECYMQDIVQTMNQTLQIIAGSSFKEQKSLERKEWIKRDPAQITLLVNNILWSTNVEDAFQKLQGGNMNSLKDYLTTAIELLTQLIKMVQGDLDKPLRQKLMCLITMDTHARDVVIRLIDEHVRKADEFQWQSQLKFYWATDNA